MAYKERQYLYQIPSLASPQAFRERAARGLYKKPQNLGIMMPEVPTPQSPSDFDLNPKYLTHMSVQKAPMQASVLVPIVKHKELTVLLTKRTEHLPIHGGQICFPGGKNDPLDRDPVATALREAREEIGLNNMHVEPIGFLDTYLTVTGYAITPVVAFLEAECPLVLNSNEVAEVIEVPLAFLMNPSNVQIHSREHLGSTRRYYVYSYKTHYIWGATAGILKNMLEKIHKP